MVQVDIVWSYAFGASFAAAAARTLEKEKEPFNNKLYTFLLLFLSIFFAPSGIYLLWKHTQWETMQVARSFYDLPAWLVVLFAVTNITQGILGYWTGYRLARKGNYWGAHANWMVSWILFWFILVCGWDCTGWQRFLYDASMHGGVLWHPGMHMGPAFFTSNVFITLVVMGVFFTPMLYRGIVISTYLSNRNETMPPLFPISGYISALRRMAPALLRISTFSLGVMFFLCLVLAILAALVVMLIAGLSERVWLGYLIGLPVVSAIGYFALFRRKGPMYLIAKQLFLKEPGE